MPIRSLAVPRAARRVTPVTQAAVAIAALALLVPGTVDGQILRTQRRADPSAWLGGSIGFWQSQTVSDGRTRSAWEFGNALQWRVSLERSLGRGNSFGIVGTWASAPLRYFSAAGVGDCANGCDATVGVGGLAATFHGGGGEGLHQVIDASAGVVQYRGFSFDRAGEGAGIELPEDDMDPFLSIGYGVGYELSPRFSVAIVQDFGVAWHQRDDLPSNTSNLVQQRVLRLTARLGGGQRRAGVR